MWRIASLVLLALIGAANANFGIFQTSTGGGSQFCPTGFTCDANGWTQFQVGPGGFVEGHTACTGAAANATCIIYVSQSLGNDANDGTFASPIQNPETARGLTRNGSPDWILLRCGDTWTNHSPSVINAANSGSGLSQGNPKLWSSYDSSAGHSPPVPNPTSCSARPTMQLDSAGTTISVSIQDSVNMHDIAIVGLKFYAWKRDPFNINFSSAESQTVINGIALALGSSNSFNNFLVEDCWVGYTTQGIAPSAGIYQPNQISNLFIRRNQIVNPYSDHFPNTGFSGMILGGVTNGPAGYIVYENTVDQAAWLCVASSCVINGHTITWATQNGFSHDLYITGSQVNGDPNPNNQSSQITLQGNIIANDPSATTFRQAAIIKDNLFVHNPQSFGFIQVQNINNPITWNTFLDGLGSAFQLSTRYINEQVNLGNSTINNNIFAHGVNGTVAGVDIQRGQSGNTATGNVFFDWPGGFNTNSGSVYTYSVTTQGSAYTDQSTSISSAASSNTPFTIGSSFTAKIDNGSGSAGNTLTVSAVAQGPIALNSTITVPGGTNTFITAQTSGTSGSTGTYTVGGAAQLIASEAMTGQSFSWASDGQNYPIFKVTNAGNIALYGTIYLNGACGLTGAYQSSVLDDFAASIAGTALVAQYVIVYAPNGYSAGACGTLGTLYYPWYQVSLTGGTGSGAQADLISVGGAIKYAYIYGSDSVWPGGGETPNNPGTGYALNDTLSATPGSACKNTTTGAQSNSGCSGGWSFNGSVTTGSGLVITASAVASNTIAATGCNLATQNAIDLNGTNVLCSFSDPGRTVGSYYATLPGATANSTFTGSVTTGTLTAGAGSSLSLGDAITWSGQIKQDYIKGNASVNSGLCSPACTGTGNNTNGTYALTGLNATVGSISMSSWTYQQFLTLVETNQRKANWNPALTACKLNQYINTGFGVTDPCVP